MATTKAASTETIDTPLALFVHELSDIRSAETIILTMLDEAIEAVSNTQLKAGLKAHRTQTEGHLKNVDQVFALIGEKPEPIECKGAKGLHEEAQDAIKEKPAPEILDSMIASGAMKTEHYEIVSYEGLVDQAKSLGQNDAAKLLQANLKEEKETLKKLEELEPKLSTKVEKLGS
jgi:ferritin-like metal-binding protein YciE